MTRLWDWAVAAYAAPGVSDACVTLQDSHDQNVPLLLWSAWTAATARTPDNDTIEAACDIARAWEGVVIAPLRIIRRTLKAPVPDIDDEPRQAVRERIKALELESERRLFEALEGLIDDKTPQSSGSRSTLDALVCTARVWAPVTPRPALTRLATALPA